MSLKLYEETNIQDIADAIRSKNGLSDTYTVAEMAQAIEDIPSGGDTFLARLLGGIKRNCRIRNLTLSQWSAHMYTLASGNYYLAYGTVPMVVYLRPVFERDSNGDVTAKISEFNYRNSINNGLLVFPSGWETTPTSMMNTGIPEDENIDSDDFNYTSNNLTITNNGNAYTNTSPVLFRPTKIYNLDTTHSHPFATELFNNLQSVTVANYMDGTTATPIDKFVECTSADIPSGFDIDSIDKGYFLYTTNNCCILVAGTSSYDGLFVNSNDKLDSTSQQNYSTQNWNSCQPGQSGSKLQLPIISRTGRPPFCEGASDNYYTNVMYNTQDIRDTNNNVIVPANISIADFKSLIFKLS